MKNIIMKTPNKNYFDGFYLCEQKNAKKYSGSWAMI